MRPREDERREGRCEEDRAHDGLRMGVKAGRQREACFSDEDDYGKTAQLWRTERDRETANPGARGQRTQ